MTRLIANDIEIDYEESGEGEPLVLVHGSWSDHHNWDPVSAALARSFRVVSYDRRGCGASQRVHGTRRDQEDDLAALIEQLDRGPAHVVGTSFGGSIATGLTTRRPDLVRSLTVHEPPLLGMVATDPEILPLMAPVAGAVQSVIEAVERGEAAVAAKQFVEELAFGPGAWELLPEQIRATMIDSAPAFVAEQNDPEWPVIDPAGLAAISCPVLLTEGDESPLWFGRIVATLGDAIDGAEMHTYAGAGHAPHISHPDDYVAAVESFLSRCGGPIADARLALR